MRMATVLESAKARRPRFAAMMLATALSTAGISCGDDDAGGTDGGGGGGIDSGTVVLDSGPRTDAGGTTDGGPTADAGEGTDGGAGDAGAGADAGWVCDYSCASGPACTDAFGCTVCAGEGGFDSCAGGAGAHWCTCNDTGTRWIACERGCILE